MSVSDTPHPPRQGRGMKLALAGAAVLVVIAGAAFYYASTLRQPAGGAVVRVVIKADRCEPDTLAVPGGKTTFEIFNASDRVVEWEILDGVMVLEERENIAPGLSARLTARLSPGTFAITCGLLNNPRGTLTVTPSAVAEGEGEARKAAATALLGAVAEYRAYLTLEAADFAAAARDLSDAIRAGDLEQAKTAYAAARTAYLHVAPVAQRFSDLDAAIDAPAAYFAAREQDPKFGGFHRIALGLWGNGGVQGLQPVAERLAADAAQLEHRLAAQTPAPGSLATGAARSLARMADLAATTGQAGGAPADADLAAGIAGVAKVVSLLAPMVGKTQPRLAQDTEAALKAALAAAAAGSADDGAARASRLRALADDLSKFNAALGLE